MPITDLKKIRAQLATWRNDLISMSRRNRLLYFAHTKASSLEFTHPAPSDIVRLLDARPHRLDFYDAPILASASPGEDGLAGKAREPRPNEVVARVRGDGDTLVPATPERLRSTLRTLRRATSQEYLDKGLRSLYLAFGMLRWFEDPNAREPCFAPLLLVPVELHHEIANTCDPLYRLPDEDAVINPALAIKLEEDFGLHLPRIEDCEDLDVDRLQRDVETIVSSQRGWSVENRVVLGRFAFHKDVMYRDLLQNEAIIADHEFVRALVDNVDEKPDYSFDPPSDEELDRAVEPEQMLSILDADSSQRKCIWAAVQGKSFAMDGPPGTGKSQTIANMIGELIARGKTVLFVSEKAAALEVVYKRLKAKGLDEYVLQLHSHKATRREVAVELGRSLERRPSLSERMPASHVKSLKDQREALSAHAEAMNETRKPMSRSLHSAIGRLAQLADVPATDADIDVGEGLDGAGFEDMLAAARTLGRAWGPVERGDDFVWRETNQSGATASERRGLEERLGRLLALLDSVRAECSSASTALGLPHASSFHEAERLVDLLDLLQDHPDVSSTWLTRDGLKRATAALEEVRRHCAERQSAEGVIRSCLGDGVDAEALRGFGSRSSAVIEGLSSLHIPIRPEPETAVRAVVEFRDELGHRLTSLGEDFAVRLEAACRHLSVEADVIDTSLAEEFLALPCLTDAADRPEAGWLDEARLEALRDARATLGAMVTSYRGMYDTVRSVFKEEILSLPVDDLALRFGTIHRGMGILRRAYRKDKKVLKPACRVGRVTRDAIAMLGNAAQLKKLGTGISEWERKHAAEFGVYYSRTETDFAALDRALTSAEKVVNAALRHPELARTTQHLVQGADFDLKTRQEIRVLRERLRLITSLTELVAGHLGSAAVIPDRVAVSDIVADLRRGHQLVAQLLEIAERVRLAGGNADSLGALLRGLQGVDQLHEAVRQMEAGASGFRASLAQRYAGFDTNISATSADLSWSEQVAASLPAPLDERGADRLVQSALSPRPLSESLSQYEKAMADFCKAFRSARAGKVRASLEGPFLDARKLVSRLLETLDDIAEWRDFDGALESLRESGLGPLAQFCVETAVPAEQVAEVCERRVLEVWVDSVIAGDKSRLAPLRSVERDSLVESFRELDRDLVRLSAGAIMAACNELRPKTALGSAGIIYRESQKMKRHMPIRNLLSAARDPAQKLKPCFMMSPLSVSQFLGPEFRFDVAIFDEASQIRPHDAINCLYRARQHVVAGDQKQLPPTSFFDAHSDDGDDWAEDQVEQYESILDKVKAAGVVPSMSLKWHYRSRHEDLITFSNYSFYDGGLITFPSPSDAVPPLGIGFTLVPGTYRRGAQRDNIIEARRVADIVAQYMRGFPKLSIGVVAFSQAQQEAIENAIDELRSRDKSLPSAAFLTDRLDGFFVKNLETVQGDERDVIVLSIGYGPDENGKVTMAFGPINAVGGYRRLNVAVTRARMRVEVVSSIRASDISDTSTTEGVRYLRKYLEYAEKGPRCFAFEGTQSLGEVESPFEAEVARTIRSWGYEVVPQVGSAGYRIDLAVRHGRGLAGFALGIECDGAAYHSSKTARDRDRLREMVLRDLGWQLYRIWGTSWYRQRKVEENRLQTAIEEAMTRCGARQTKVALSKDSEDARTTEVVVKDVQLTTSVSDSDWVIDYEAANPTVLAKEKAMPLGDPGAQLSLCKVVEHVVSVEQPIHTSLLQDRLLEAWGCGRAGSRIQQNIEIVLRRLEREKTIKGDDAGFVRLVGCAPVEAVRRPVAGDPRTERSAQQVSREEYMLAVRRCQELAPGIMRDELSIQVAGLFGWERRGHEILEAIDAAIDASDADLP